MIITFLLTAFLAIMQGLFSALPSIPPIPTAISDVGDQLIAFIGNSVSVLVMLLGGPLLAAAVGVALALFFFTKIYYVVMWVLKKIPLINLK